MASSVEGAIQNSHENGIEKIENDKKSEIDLLKEECQKWRDKSERLQTELDETKSEVAVANCVKESMIELDRQKRGLDSEMATMQQLLTESHDEVNSQKTRYEHEMARLRAVLDQLEMENRELRIQMKLSERNAEGGANPITVDKDTLLGGAAALKDVTSNFARKVKSNLNSVMPQQGSTITSAPNVSQEKPLSPSAKDEEIEDSQINSLPGSAEGKHSPTGTSDDPPASRSSGTNLEVGMIKAYEDTELLKSIVLPLEEQIEALKDKLRQTDNQLIESEKRQTKIVLGVEALAKWLEGKPYNEAARYLENRQKELLSFSELKRLDDEEREDEDYVGSDHKLGGGNQTSNQTESLQTQIYTSLLLTRIALLQKELCSAKSEVSSNSMLSDKIRKSNTDLRNQVYNTNSEIVRIQRNHLSELSRISSVLTEEQKCQVSAKKAEEDEKNKQHLSDDEKEDIPTSDNYEAKSNKQEVVGVKKSEWLKMEVELNKVRALLGVGVEDTLVGGGKFRELQIGLEEMRKKCDTHAKNEEKLKEELVKESEFRQKVECEWNERADQHKLQVDALNAQIKQSETIFEHLRLNYGKMYQLTQKDLKTLTVDREKIVRELKRLQDENDNLVGKYSVKAEEMQNEIIDLPEKLEDIHLLLLRYREDLITVKLAKERLEEKLKSEVSFLKAQVAGEQQAKEDVEDQLTTEVEQLKEKIYLLESCKSELEAEQKRRKEYEENQVKHRETNANLQSQMDSQIVERHELENKIVEMNARIKNLQQELDNSVAVQTDFVRLSQSLQMELEKIRQGEEEVKIFAILTL